MSGGLHKHVFSGSPEAIGAAHGATWPAEIAALAELRSELTIGRSDLTERADLRTLAAAHLPVLRAFDEALYQELQATAAASGVSPEELVVLNHYTDIRDVRRPEWGPLVEAQDPGGCSMALIPGAGGAPAVTGQTWEMHGSARPFVRLVEFRADGAPAATMLTLTGCLGMAGMNEAGLAVLINNLTSTDARVGVLWCALVRRMLRETTVAGAWAVLEGATLGSGHHYLITDGREAVSVETSGRDKAVLSRSAGERLLHTNHCLAEGMRATERVPDGSTTWLRYDHLARRAGALGAGTDAEALAAAFATHEGYPRSLCIHVTREAGAGPHAVDSCSTVVFDHAERRMLCVGGCAVEEPWVETRVGDDAARRVAIATTPPTEAP